MGGTGFHYNLPFVVGLLDQLVLKREECGKLPSVCLVAYRLNGIVPEDLLNVQLTWRLNLASVKWVTYNSRSFHFNHRITNGSSGRKTQMVTKLQRSDSIDRIAELLGPDASKLLDHTSQTISKEDLHLPGPDFVDRVWGISDRPAAVLRSMQTLLNNGRLAGTGYLSILPVDQGIEHSAGASFAPNPQSIRKTSSGSLLTAAVMQWLRPSACLAQLVASTRTRFRLS